MGFRTTATSTARLLLQRPWIALLLALALESVFVVAGRTDFVASDPLWYAEIAHRISTDPFEVFAAHDTHPFMMRIGLTVPLAVLYRVLGVSTVVSNLPCFAAALGMLLVVYAAAGTPRSKLLGMLFGVASIPLVRHAEVLNVDLPCAALMSCSILWLSWRARPRGRYWLVAAALAWVGAFLIKETALWCGVVWLYAIACDVRAGDARSVVRRFATALVVGAALAVGYGLLCARLWGSPWARFEGIEDLTYGHAWTLHGQPIAGWVDRLTWQPLVLLFTMFQATLIPVALAPCLVRGSDRIWWIATAAFALLYWFGSTSFSAYSPLPISQRMALPLLPGILVLAALASDRALERLRESRWRSAIVAGFLVAMVVPAAYVIGGRLVHGRPETASFAALEEDVSEPSRRVVLVCGEPRCVAISAFYFGFAPPPNLTVAFAGDFAHAPLPERATVRALVNLTRSPGARRTDPRLDMTGPIEALRLRPIVWDRSVRLYDAGNGERLWSALRASD